MFMVSWQLSLLAFISVPVITIVSKWYGGYLRSLTKIMQTKLAEGNSVSEAAISSMPTVRAFDAGLTEYKEFKKHMDEVSVAIYIYMLKEEERETVTTTKMRWKIIYTHHIM